MGVYLEGVYLMGDLFEGGLKFSLGSWSYSS